MSITTEQIAAICHDANRRYCIAKGDESQVPWEQAPDWQKESAKAGVEAVFQGKVLSPEQSHMHWRDHKAGDGWKYGPVKDMEKKEHPCMVPYDELPVEQRFKDSLFFNIVKTWE